MPPLPNMNAPIIFHKNAFLRRKPACATVDPQVLGAFDNNFSGDLKCFNRIIPSEPSGSTVSQANGRTACHRVSDKLVNAKSIRLRGVIKNVS